MLPFSLVRILAIPLILAAIQAATYQQALAEEPVIPGFQDSKERLRKPQLSNLQRLRFLTTIDFPPFNFLDGNGHMSGFHVDLARAICDELEVKDRCQIQALPWEDLYKALEAGQGEAAIAGIAINAESRQKYAFSRSYLQFPARLITRKDAPVEEPLYQELAGKRIGVMAQSSHERMLREYFPAARIVVYGRQKWLLNDLKNGRLFGVFGDGMRLSFWLAGTSSDNCCQFSGGAYLATEYLGNGLSIATLRDREDLQAAFNYALRELEVNGIFAEIYLRYFPVSFF